MIKVKVPATSANLGAGFDSVGIALSLYNYVYLDYSDKLEIVNLDDGKVSENRSNLIYRSVVELFKFCGEKIPEGFLIKQENNIPQTRGLGSSSACIVAGLFAANKLLGFPLKLRDILKLAVKIEGHPDNVAPAIFGGLVSCACSFSNIAYFKSRVSTKLRFVALVPNFRLSTSKGRKVLPKNVAFHDAVFNVSRAVLFFSSISGGKFKNLKIASQDRLHQNFRLKLIENGTKVFKIAYDLGAYSVYLSGSGPTIVAICDIENDKFLKNIRSRLNEVGLSNWRVSSFTADNFGAVAENVT